ncbi:hypothetical protein ACFFOS_27660 [Nocardioides kongjuensis]|uniref:Uncharacterized protein n=1 Tax=Nocardioides kongjuensis TaxID=349522 RepID=A0A852RTK9_9ACTN|nr:hypothetical protein [Nocardioides kongjuensis]NYD33848.1 hypothetical protein [Nocardioides kongjuensis]
MADTWLEPSTVTAVLGSVASDLPAGDLDGIVPGVRGWVEDKRKDLLVGDGGDPEVFTFTPTPQVVLGAAFLVWRTYDRRRSPVGIVGASEDGYAGIVRDDPDIARFLGIGAAGRFVFGGHNPTTEAVV